MTGRSKHVSFNAAHGTDAVVFVYWPGVCAGSIPKELGSLIKLTRFNLSGNKLTGKGVCVPVVASLCGPRKERDAEARGVPAGGPVVDLVDLLATRIPILPG